MLSMKIIMKKKINKAVLQNLVLFVLQLNVNYEDFGIFGEREDINL